MGSGWLSVAVIPARTALSGVLPADAQPNPDTSSPGWYANPDSKAARQQVVKIPAGPPALGQLASLLPVLLKAATPVHGAWGSGRLLRTNLFSVLITSKGKVLIGAVTSAVLFADAAKAK